MYNRIEPGMLQAVFNDWDEAEQSNIDPAAKWVIVNGLFYKRWEESSVLALRQTLDGAYWAPPVNNVLIEHFYYPGITTQQAAQNAFDWCALYSSLHPIYITASRPFGQPVTLDAAGRIWEVSEPTTLSFDNANLTVRDGGFSAIGNGWADEDFYDTWVWRDYVGPHGTIAAADVEIITRNVCYRPRHSDFIIVISGGASKVTFENTIFYANQRCGGMSLSAGCRANNVRVLGCSGVGFTNTGGAAEINNCWVRQWEINEPGYLDHEAYTGVGISTDETDLRVGGPGMSIGWMKELVRFENTNNTLWGGHYFNGSQNYLAATRLTSPMSVAELQEVFDYFKGKGDPQAAGWITPTDVITHDFTVRTEHRGFVTAALRDQADYEAGPPDMSPMKRLTTLRMDVSFNAPYTDNCHHDFFTHGVAIRGLDIGSKKSSSLTPVNSIIRYYSPIETANPRFIFEGLRPYVESTNFSADPDAIAKHFVNFLPHPLGEQWSEDYTIYNADTVYNWLASLDGILGMGYTIASQSITSNTKSAANPNQIFYDPGVGSYLGTLDGSSTLIMMYGSVGDVGTITFAGSPANMKFKPTGVVNTPNTPVYASNVAALAGGLVVGDNYRTAAGVKMEVF